MINWPAYCGPSYRLSSPNIACDRCINLYPEVLEQGARKGQLRLAGIPGLADFVPGIGLGPIRAVWSSAKSGPPDIISGIGQDRLFVISGAELYEVFSNGTSNLIGKVGADQHPAYITSNGFQLAIASAGAAYIAPGGGNPVVPIVDTLGDPIEAQSIAFQDQYFIAAIKNTKRLMVSNLAPAGGTWDPQNVAIKEGYADNISRVWVDQPGGTYLWIFGDETTEVWTNTAGPFPFSRVPGMVFPVGADSPWSVAGISGVRFWYWRGRVYGATGFQPERISDFAIEEAIKTYSQYDQQNCEAWAWMEGGHTLYALTFPEANITWVYDATMKCWHERLHWRADLGKYERYIPRMGAHAFGTVVVGDYRSNKLYKLQSNVYTDAGGSILRRERIAPWITDSNLNDRYLRFELDMDTAIGLSVPEGTWGFDPNVFMKYSIDRGKTYSNEMNQRAGKIGETDVRVFWGPLGASRIGLTTDVVFTDPCPFNINNAYLDISAGTYPRRGQ